MKKIMLLFSFILYIQAYSTGLQNYTQALLFYQENNYTKAYEFLSHEITTYNKKNYILFSKILNAQGYKTKAKLYLNKVLEKEKEDINVKIELIKLNFDSEKNKSKLKKELKTLLKSIKKEEDKLLVKNLIASLKIKNNWIFYYNLTGTFDNNINEGLENLIIKDLKDDNGDYYEISKEYEDDYLKVKDFFIKPEFNLAYIFRIKKDFIFKPNLRFSNTSYLENSKFNLNKLNLSLDTSFKKSNFIFSFPLEYNTEILEGKQSNDYYSINFKTKINFKNSFSISPEFAYNLVNNYINSYEGSRIFGDVFLEKKYYRSALKFGLKASNEDYDKEESSLKSYGLKFDYLLNLKKMYSINFSYDLDKKIYKEDDENYKMKREDSLSYYYLELSKTLKKIKLSLHYEIKNNSSNMELYHFKHNMLSFTISNRF